MTQNNIKTILGFIGLGTLLYSIHKILFFTDAQAEIYSLEVLYIFHTCIALSMYIATQMLKSNHKDLIAIAYLAFVFVKIILMYFGFEDVFEAGKTDKPMLYAFVVAYLSFLIAEVYVLIQVVNSINFKTH
ncbi:MAG: hypothetical protein ACPGEC_03170 [Flavobacteriales bacterium]